MEALQTKKNTLEALIQQIRSAPDTHVGNLVDHLRAHASLEEMPPLPPNPTPAPAPAPNPTPPQDSAPPEEMVRKRKRGESRVGGAGRGDDGRIAQDVGVLEVDAGGGLRHFGVQNVVGFVHGSRRGVRRTSVGPVKWTGVTKDPGFMNELLVSTPPWRKGEGGADAEAALLLHLPAPDSCASARAAFSTRF